MSAPISASGSPSALRLTPTTALWVLVAASLVARLVAGALAPLSEDEAYYRLWSLKPAFGYFDHPPMVAWWTWLGRLIAGDTPLGVRLVFALGAGVTTLLAFDLARVAGLGERVALRAALWFNATLLIGLGGELAVPDAPGTLFWTAALCCAFRAVNGRYGAWWLAAGAAAGLACLSKYSALFLAPGVVLWLVLTREGRRALATPWPWLAAAIAVAVFAPNVAWNAQHGWVTFQKQFGRVAEGGLAPGFLAKLLLDQTLLLNPLIAVFLGAGGLAAAHRLAAAGSRRAVRALPRDPQPARRRAGPVALAALHLARPRRGGRGGAAHRGWLALAAHGAPVGRASPSAAGLALAFIALRLYDGALPVRDPSASWRDWPGFLARVEQTRAASGAAWIGAPDYGFAAQLASAPQIHAPATEIYERGRFTFETPAERADFTRPGLIVSPPKQAALPAISACFAVVRQLPNLVRGEGHSAAVYGVFLVAQPRRDVERDGCYRADLPNFASSQAGTVSTRP